MRTSEVSQEIETKLFEYLLKISLFLSDYLSRTSHEIPEFSSLICDIITVPEGVIA